ARSWCRPGWTWPPRSSPCVHSSAAAGTTTAGPTGRGPSGSADLLAEPLRAKVGMPEITPALEDRPGERGGPGRAGAVADRDRHGVGPVEKALAAAPAAHAPGDD